MFALAATLSAGSDLQNVKKVYVFPMRSGMDQYLTSALAEAHVLQVVSDPKAADAVLTDKVGPAFEEAFDRLVLDVKPKGADMAKRASFSSGRGTIFLVSRSKQVIWSTYAPPKDNSAGQLERTARRTVGRLKKELSPAANSGN